MFLFPSLFFSVSFFLSLSLSFCLSFFLYPSIFFSFFLSLISFLLSFLSFFLSLSLSYCPSLSFSSLPSSREISTRVERSNCHPAINILSFFSCLNKQTKKIGEKSFLKHLTKMCDFFSFCANPILTSAERSSLCEQGKTAVKTRTE